MGTILAPNTTEGWTNCYANTWLGFWNVSNLIVNGSGEINGSGSIWWKNFSVQVWNSFSVNTHTHTHTYIYIYIYIYIKPNPDINPAYEIGTLVQPMDYRLNCRVK